MNKCLFCNELNKNNVLFCIQCNKILEILHCDIMLGFFNIYTSKEMLNIDLIDIECKYAELILIMHPDKFIYTSPKEKIIAEKNTALINEIYKILLNCENRYQYILKDINIHNIDCIKKYFDLFNLIHSEFNANDYTYYKLQLTDLYNTILCKIENFILSDELIEAKKFFEELQYIKNLLNTLDNKINDIQFKIK